MLLSNRGNKILQNINQCNTNEELFQYIANAYSNDTQHAHRMFKYMTNHQFTPSTPIIANVPIKSKTFKGLPISCFLSECSKENNLFVF